MKSFLSLAPVKVTNQTAEGLLIIEWCDGSSISLTHSTLRQSCRCADCLSGRLRIDEGVKSVRIDQVKLTGTYALNFEFDDGHDRGIYPWAYLHELAHRSQPVGAS